VNRKALVGAGLAATTIMVATSPASAHGIGGRIDLPLPVWQLAWAAGFAVAISFVALGAFWKTPRLAAASVGEPLPNIVQRAGSVVDPLLRMIGLITFAIVFYGAWWGNTSPALNIAPQITYIWFWVGMQFAAMLLGDFWQSLNPYWTIADLAAGLKARITGEPLSDCTAIPKSEWPAVLAITSFLWMELAYHSSSSPRSLGVWLTGYTFAMLGGASIWGRAWVRSAEGFGVLFSKLAAISPFHRDAGGTFRFRAPLSGLATMPIVPGSIPFVLVVLGSTSFDGFTRNSIWRELVTNRSGWELTVYRTVGFAVAVAIVAGAFNLAVLAMSHTTGTPRAEVLHRFGPSLIPIAGAYSVAHYFSFVFLDGQILWRLMSDPFGRGWDLFGTIGYRVHYTAISPRQIAWVQTLSIAIGHVLGVATAHDKAVESYPRDVAVRSQYPMLGVMITYTVLGLLILLGG